MMSRLPAAAAAILFVGFAGPALAQATDQAPEQLQVTAPRHVLRTLSDPTQPVIDADGLLANGIVADGPTVG